MARKMHEITGQIAGIDLDFTKDSPIDSLKKINLLKDINNETLKNLVELLEQRLAKYENRQPAKVLRFKVVKGGASE